MTGTGTQGWQAQKSEFFVLLVRPLTHAHGTPHGRHICVAPQLELRWWGKAACPLGVLQVPELGGRMGRVPALPPSLSSPRLLSQVSFPHVCSEIWGGVGWGTPVLPTSGEAKREGF